MNELKSIRFHEKENNVRFYISSTPLPARTLFTSDYASLKIFRLLSKTFF